MCTPINVARRAASTVSSDCTNPRKGCTCESEGRFMISTTGDVWHRNPSQDIYHQLMEIARCLEADVAVKTILSAYHHPDSPVIMTNNTRTNIPELCSFPGFEPVTCRTSRLCSTNRATSFLPPNSAPCVCNIRGRMLLQHPKHGCLRCARFLPKLCHLILQHLHLRRAG